MDLIYRHFMDGFERALAERKSAERRIGAEMKFPLVRADGTAVSLETTRALWEHLIGRGWQPVRDSVSGDVVGATKPGEQNDTMASCETGFCKSEFSLAHVADLFELQRKIDELRDELQGFSDRYDAYFLGYGIQPLTPPSKRLLMPKSRSSVWDKIFSSNRHVAPEDGDDVHLFTINAASHVHVSVSPAEAIGAVNVLNGLAGGQIALTAHSNVWRGRVDTEHKCVAEMFWDWWIPESNRVGVPERPFRDLRDYVETISAFRPIFVRRDGVPIMLTRYRTFADYYSNDRAVGFDLDGRERAVVPEAGDIDVHGTCYWYSARLSHYYTVENRANDQQPPEELTCVPALTLGLMSALPEAVEAIRAYDWGALRAARAAACRDALEGRVDGVALRDLAAVTLDLARLGLERRGRGEETLLEPLERRLSCGAAPADEAARLFETGGASALVAARKL